MYSVLDPPENPMLKRIAAIAFIFICTAIAWGILGGTIFSRTYSPSITDTPSDR
jgi:hypothetical protein